MRLDKIFIGKVRDLVQQTNNKTSLAQLVQVKKFKVIARGFVIIISQSFHAVKRGESEN